MPVGELELRMTQRELHDWLRFEALTQPLPDKLSDIHFAMVCSVATNLARALYAPDAQAATPRDFMVIRDREPAPPDDGLSEVDRQRIAWRGG